MNDKVIILVGFSKAEKDTLAKIPHQAGFNFVMSYTTL